MNEIAERVRKTVNESDHPGDFVSAARTACIEIDLLQSKLDLYVKACAEAVECTRIMEGMSVAGAMQDCGVAPELCALFEVPK